MSTESNPKPIPNQLVIYQIRLKGHLSCEWTDWFEGLTITLEEDGDTLLTGPVIDQATLHGLLKKARDLGLPLVSVSPVESGQTDLAQSLSQVASRHTHCDDYASISFKKGE